MSTLYEQFFTAGTVKSLLTGKEISLKDRTVCAEETIGTSQEKSLALTLKKTASCQAQ